MEKRYGIKRSQPRFCRPDTQRRRYATDEYTGLTCVINSETIQLISPAL